MESFRSTRFHYSSRLARTLRGGRFEIRVDTAFEAVIRACAERADEEGTWISDEIVESYEELARLGIAHSVEVWRDGALVGGLYGVHLGGVFFGESMFHRTADASKVALVSPRRASPRAGVRAARHAVDRPRTSSSSGRLKFPRTEYSEKAEDRPWLSTGSSGLAPVVSAAPYRVR